ncbi:hypothetical protein J6500_08425 [Bradyrhizobium sp. WSM 1704]|uniref:hypothetical protein n=1 Tax=Bradyrhizobium semiaridum TaxID=2821404 RepID=UPI001CE346E5|nr:hypothetical protein [Bradyrhizobium semiaridum]MCA6121921.1 hypothetical protein [Bradyrhizobium semiaridum]
MSVVFFAITAIAAIWSAVRSEVLRRELVDSLPPQFQDDLMSRYAVHTYALAPSTSLPLQTEYMKVLYAGCAAALSGSLGFFASGNPALGCFVLIGFLWAAYQTFKSWKAYQANCAGSRSTE